jgi:two-component system LytT family response regulator/two-component system response regulator LytT
MRVLVVDDEAPARSELLHLLGAHDGVIADEAPGAADALARVRDGGYDAVFLDIEMPGLTGLDAAALVRAATPAPAVVFVTAHHEYAVEAFAVEAVDYLLKPVDPERLARVVERLRERAADDEAPARKIPVVAGGRTELIDVEQVHFAQADGDYCRVHTYDRSYLATVTLGELEESLPQQRFARIHRSYVVNLGKVAAVKRAGNDRMRLVLDDATRTELDVARRQSRRVRELLRL